MRKAWIGHVVADCNESLRLLPEDNVDALDDQAYAYLIHGDFDAAIAEFTAVLKLDPQRASALSGRGVAERKKGDNVAADRDLSDASVA